MQRIGRLPPGQQTADRARLAGRHASTGPGPRPAARRAAARLSPRPRCRRSGRQAPGHGQRHSRIPQAYRRPRHPPGPASGRGPRCPGDLIGSLGFSLKPAAA
jgi:hypothetical protein